MSYTEYASKTVRSMFTSAAQLRSKWSDTQQRAVIIESLEDRGISIEQLLRASGSPDADPFDLLCHVAFNAPLRTRRERAQRLREERKDFFDQYAPEARAILNELLDKYAEYGTAQFVLPDALQIPPISDRGNVIEIAKMFGGGDKLRDAVNQLQTLLYAA